MKTRKEILDEILNKYESSNPKMDFLLWFTTNYEYFKAQINEAEI